MGGRVRDTDRTISDWLEGLKPTSAVFWRAEARAPWGVHVGTWDTAVFHILTKGSATLNVEGIEESVHLETGDLVLLPAGTDHGLRDSPSSPLPPLQEVVQGCTAEGKWVHFGGDGAPTVMLCGACQLGTPRTRPPTSLLPAYVRHPLDPGLVQVAEQEARGLRSGADAVLVQLLTLLVMQALRAHLSDRTPQELGAVFAPEVGRAVQYIHAHLADEIRLDDLCRQAALSRTVLSERFREALGVSPIEYVRLTRLSRAAELITASGSGLARIAREVGYSSLSTFSRAFRGVYGASPGAYRRAALEER